MHSALSIGQFEARLFLAFFLGALIGLERQWRHKLAGIKTNSLVAGGAALFILLSEKIVGDSSSAARVAAQIVTGIGFLGAGVIMREGFNVTGLNTSATIWCSGAVGAIAGMGYWYEASVGSAFVLLAHVTLRPISQRLDKRISQIESTGNKYLLEMVCNSDSMDDARLLLVNTVKSISTLHISSIRTENTDTIYAEIRSLDKRQTDIEELVHELGMVRDLRSIKWEDLKTGK